MNITNATGDYGVDLVAAKHSVRTAVQCERQARPVGVAAIQQAVAGAPMHRCTATMGGVEQRIHAASPTACANP